MRILPWAFLVAALLLSARTPAATPAEGRVSVDAPETSYVAGPMTTSGGVGCIIVGTCDVYTLTVDLPDDYAVLHPDAHLRFHYAWSFVGDLFLVTFADEDGNDLPSAGGNTTDLGAQITYFKAGSGTRTIVATITPYAANQSIVNATVTLVSGDDAGLVPNRIGPGVPRYTTYMPPDALSGAIAEPSVGYNTTTRQAFVLSGLNTLWATFPQDQSPPLPASCEAEWENRSAPLTTLTSLDPIGLTDSLVRGHETNRTFIGQLIGLNSAASYSDDDGATWVPMQGGPPLAATDHQTFGAGPYPPGLELFDALDPYPNAVYYCGQDVAFASCARSDNGGLTFGAPVPIYTIAECGGIHGHVRVAPDGTVYVPNRYCGAQVAVTVSEDGGSSWSVRKVPGTRPAIRDSQIAIATDGTGYYCFSEGDTHAAVAVTHDKGLTWEPTVALGRDKGIKHVMFTQAVAGDADRAVCAYLGTTTEGNPVSADFPGLWHLYFSTTYDGGRTWTTINATPSDPVQGAGGIWNAGGSSLNRNLLDFNEMTLDERGYPMYGYADGCVGDCVRDPIGENTFAAMPRLTRQTGGKPLYAEFDPVEPRTPGAACLAGSRIARKARLTWKAPDNGGARISEYRIYRGTQPGTGQLIGTADRPRFVDDTLHANVERYWYTVKAVNRRGEGVASNEILVERLRPAAAP